MMRHTSPVTALTTPAPRRHRPRHALALAVTASLLGVALATLPISPGAALAADANHIRVSGSAIGSTQPVTMSLNKSLLLDLPQDAAEVIISQPGVATAIMRSKRRAVVQTTGMGTTNIFFLDAAGRTITVLDVAVKAESSNVAAALRDTFARLLPHSNIAVESVVLRDSNGDEINRVVLSGRASSAADADTAMRIATQFAGSADNVANVIEVSGPQQVMLRVTVAEVQREAIKQLGIDLSAGFDNGTISTSVVSSQALGGSSNVVTTNGFGLDASIGNFTLEAKLNALERHGALRTLAEPVLTAASGQPAEFFAGGEFPVPVSVADDGTIGYTFKQFGVKLSFTPTIKSGGKIGLLVDTSVSEPTTEGAATLGTLTIPATKNREARSTVELGAGQTLALGGMMQESVRTQINRLPGLGDIPILGTLFRSRDFIHNQTELVILVTPYYAHGGEMPVLPTDELTFAGDAEAIFLGHIEKVYGVGPGGMRGSYDGSVGFLLD